MKITVKSTSLSASTRINKETFECNARLVLKTVVKPNIEIAKNKTVKLSDTQKAQRLPLSSINSKI